MKKPITKTQKLLIAIAKNFKEAQYDTTEIEKIKQELNIAEILYKKIAEEQPKKIPEIMRAENRIREIREEIKGIEEKIRMK